MSGSESETFNVVIKSSSDSKYEIPTTNGSTIAELKAAIAEKSDIAVERQRLIYAGKVLKDTETVETYKIKPGQTVHLVKGAGTTTGPSTTASSGATTGGATTGGNGASGTNSQVPTNIAAGQGSGNILADLTGARYAGLAQLPSASMFGPDGGMGPAPGPDEIISMLEQPGVAESMQQALQNPQMIDMMINSNPRLRSMGPQFRQMMQSPQFRDMITNPQMMRQMLQMEQMMSGMSGGAGGAGGAGGFPAPGSGDDNSGTRTAAAGANATTGANAGAGAGLGGLGAGAAGNPFAALFGGAGGPGAGLGAGAEAGAGGAAGANPLLDPSILQSFLGGGAAPAPEDNRPPEERYESQLQQLNELGFFDFDRNVRALRRSGGNVQGAVEALLDGQV